MKFNRYGWLFIALLVTLLFCSTLADFISYPRTCALKTSDLPTMFVNHIKGRISLSQKVEPLILDISFRGMSTIRADRERAMKTGINVEPTKVPAKITMGGKTYRAKVRLKGDNDDHFAGKIWSLRVEIDKGAVLGMRNFSLQSPKVRNGIVEPIFMDEARKLGLIAPRYGFVTMTINGESYGLVAYEEHMGKALLEMNERKEVPILAYSDIDLWKYARENRDFNFPVNPYQNFNIVPIKTFERKLVVKSPALLDKESYSRWLLVGYQNQMLNPEAVFDKSQFRSMALLGDAWNTTHPVYWPNVKFALNAFTLKLEPIIFDNGHIPVESSKSINYNKDYSEPLYSLIRSGFALPSQKEIDAAKALDKNWYQERRDYYYNLIKDYEACYDLDFEPILKNKEHIKDTSLYYTGDLKENNSESLLTALADWKSKYRASKFHKHVESVVFTDKKIIIKSYMTEDIILEKMKLNFKSQPMVEFEINKVIPSNIPGVGKNAIEIDLNQYSKNIPLSDAVSVEFLTRYDGQSAKTVVMQEEFITPYKNPLEPSENLKKLSFIQITNDSILIKPGKWKVLDPLVFPYGKNLKVSAGTTLEFSSRSYMVVHGKIEIEGTESHPVVLTGMGQETWMGLYVLEAKETSKIQSARFYNLNSIAIPPLSLTGAISFYRANVIMSDVKIEGVKTEDAINVTQSTFDINRVSIKNTISDAVDMDFTKGRLTDITFSDIGGDALDFSGSQVEVEGVVADRIKDKAISVGEQSTAKINKGDFTRVGSGIAVKDGSRAEASAVKVSDYKVAPFLVYGKKTEYPSSFLDLKVDEEYRSQSIAQIGNTFMFNGKKIKETNLDVEELYKNGAMKKR